MNIIYFNAYVTPSDNYNCYYNWDNDNNTIEFYRSYRWRWDNTSLII